jgi:NAD(P)H-dependent FMN reductase
MKTLIISSSLSGSSRSYEVCTQVQTLMVEQWHEVTLYDARGKNIPSTHLKRTDDIVELRLLVEKADTIIIWCGIHCYSINDNLKIILDRCFGEATGKFYGIVCAAWGEKSYLATSHLTQICMNERRMIQLPRTVYVTWKDFCDDGKLKGLDVIERVEVFVDEFIDIGGKLLG